MVVQPIDFVPGPGSVLDPEVLLEESLHFHQALFLVFGKLVLLLHDCVFEFFESLFKILHVFLHEL